MKIISKGNIAVFALTIPVAFLILSLFAPTFAHAQVQPTGQVQPGGSATSPTGQVQPGGSAVPPQGVPKLQNPLKANSVGELVQNFVEIVSYLVILFAVLMLVWTGLQYILARGNPTKMSDLSKRLMWIIVGIAIVIGARVIISIVINTLKATGTVDPTVIQSADNALQGR
jgi:hypothetical protein